MPRLTLANLKPIRRDIAADSLVSLAKSRQRRGPFDKCNVAPPQLLMLNSSQPSLHKRCNCFAACRGLLPQEEGTEAARAAEEGASAAILAQKSPYGHSELTCVPCRTSLPQEEGTEAARAAEEEAHRAAMVAERRLASREWAEARTPRNSPMRNLNMLDVVSTHQKAASRHPAK